MIAAAISGWIITGQVQQRMKKTLGRKATDLELASLRTWMEVENEEKLRESGEVDWSEMRAVNRRLTSQ